MADYCRAFDEGLWDDDLRSMTILCEGHAAYEDLDAEGYPTASINAFAFGGDRYG